MIRLLLIVLLVLTMALYFQNSKEVETPGVEDGFVGGPVKALHKAEQFESSYLDAAAERKKKMEEQLEQASID